MTRSDRKPVALTVAGSDSGGGAGIQADLRVFSRIGVLGTSAITAVTAQNLSGVSSVVGLEAAAVRDQIEAVRGGFDVRAAKTGMLWSREIVEAVAAHLGADGLPVVVDPVMVATSGARLLDEDAVEAYRRELLPRAALATPNLDEAVVLLDRPVTAEEMRSAAERMHDRFGCPVLLKGGHLDGDPVDVLRYGGGFRVWRHPRLGNVHTHGSGCILSSAIAAFLALGDTLERACERGLAFVHDALRRGIEVAEGVRLAGIEQARDDVSVLERVE